MEILKNMNYLNQLFTIAVLHFLGDYVLQTNFIAESKGSNWYHMIVHCVLYAWPFAVFYGFDYHILVLIFTHLAIDAGKARWHEISYVQDQVMHFGILFIMYLNT